MKIIRLKAENVKRVEAIDITPNGQAVIIGGVNFQGKSSVMDAITMALAGGRSIPARPIRDGEKSGEIVVETEELIITRTLTENNRIGSLKITTKDGLKYPSPQTILDALHSNLTFDPTAFGAMDKPARERVVRIMAGLDFTSIETDKTAILSKIQFGKKEVTRIKNEADAKNNNLAEVTKKIPGSTTADCDFGRAAALAKSHLQEAMTELAEINAAESSTSQLRFRYDETVKAVKGAEVNIIRYENEIASITQQITALVIRQDEIAELRENAMEDMENKKASASELEKQIKEQTHEKNRAEVQARIKNHDAAIAELEKTNRLIAVQETIKKDIDRLKVEAEAVSGALEQHDIKLKQLADKKADMIKNARFPVEGLSINDGGLIYKGIPFEQLSESERLIVSTKIGMALNPKLKVLLLRGGAALDKNSLGTLLAMAELDGYQLWIERVLDDENDPRKDGCSVIIHEGRVIDNKLV